MDAKITAVDNNIIDNEPGIQAAYRRPSSTPSFDGTLQNEQTKLEERKKTLSMLPWTDLQRAFQAVPLEFEFKFSAAPGEFDLAKERAADDPRASRAQTGAVNADSSASKGKPEISSEKKIEVLMSQNDLIQKLTANNKYAAADIRTPFNLSSIAAAKISSADMDMVISELVDRVRMIKEGEKVSLSIALKPDNLGELLLNISMRNGIVTVSIAADQEAKDWIEANMNAMEETLKRANINLGSFEVSSHNDGRRSYEAKADIPEILNAVSFAKTKEPSSSADPFLYVDLFAGSSNIIFSRV